MDKKELEQKVETLRTMVQESQMSTSNYTGKLANAEKQLADVNKPVLTPEQLDSIQQAIEKAVDGFDFSDNDNYSIEYGIDYDGRVHCESLELSDSYQLVESITDKVHALFVEAEDEPTADQINNANQNA